MTEEGGAVGIGGRAGRATWCRADVIGGHWDATVVPLGHCWKMLRSKVASPDLHCVKLLLVVLQGGLLRGGAVWKLDTGGRLLPWPRHKAMLAQTRVAVTTGPRHVGHRL